MVEYWERLKPFVEARSLDTQGLADALNITYQAVRKMKNGGSFGSVNNSKAAKYFGLDANWLATGVGSAKPSQRSNDHDPFAFETVDVSRWSRLSERQKGRVEKAINDELDAIERELQVKNGTHHS